jgi:hypothetical protein
MPLRIEEGGHDRIPDRHGGSVVQENVPAHLRNATIATRRMKSRCLPGEQTCYDEPMQVLRSVFQMSMP